MNLKTDPNSANNDNKRLAKPYQYKLLHLNMIGKMISVTYRITVLLKQYLRGANEYIVRREVKIIGFRITTIFIMSIVFAKIECLASELGHIGTLLKHTDAVNTIAVSPDGKYFASGGTDSLIIVWDLNSYQVVRSIPQKNVVLTATFNKNGSCLIAGGIDSNGKVWNVKTGELISTLKGHDIEIRVVTLSKNKNYLATGSTDHTTIVRNFSTGERVRTIHNKMPVISLDFSPNGNYLAAGGWENNIEIWDLAWDNVRKIGYGHSASVRSVKYSPNGLLLVSASEDNTIRLWNPLSAECKEVIPAHDSFITSIDFSPDGKLLLTASFDKTIKIWDTYSWQLIRTITGHQSGILSAAFAKNGELILSGDEGGVINVWAVEPISYAIDNLNEQKKSELNQMLNTKKSEGDNQIATYKQQIIDKYNDRIKILTEQKKDIINQSVKNVTLEVSRPGQYNKATQIVTFTVADQILSIKVPSQEANLLVSQWYRLSSNGYIMLSNYLLSNHYHFTEIKSPINNKVYKVIKQESISQK